MTTEPGFKPSLDADPQTICSLSRMGWIQVPLLSGLQPLPLAAIRLCHHCSLSVAAPWPGFTANVLPLLLSVLREA